MTIDQDQLAAIQHAHRAGWAPRADHRKFLLDAVETLQAENERLRVREGHALEYERCIVWDTTCSGCADRLDEAYQDHMKAAEAEAADLRTRLDEAEAGPDQWKRAAEAHEMHARAAEARLANVRALLERWESEDVDDLAADDSYDPALALRSALDGPQDGGPNWTAIRGEGYMPQDGGDGR